MPCLRTCVVLIGLCCFTAVCGVYGTPQRMPSDGNARLLSCGARSMQLVVPAISAGNTSLTVQDVDRQSFSLQNDTRCGTWVSWRPDGSVVIGVDYTGCYISEQDGEYVLTLYLDHLLPGQNATSRKRLRCPNLLAKDAPSPDACAAVARVNRLSCGSLPITQLVCQDLDCCYDPSDSSKPCYFGKPVTGQCSADGQATIAISTDAAVPALNLDSLRLLTVTSNCRGLSSYGNQAFKVYRFPLSCGGVVQVLADTVYENRLEAISDILTHNQAFISRDSTFRLTVRCTFASSSGSIPLQVEVFTLPPPLPVSSPGPLLLEMRIARERTYDSYYIEREYPVVKILRDPVFVEVRVLQRTDPSLVLVLNACWATPSSNPMQQPQWPILVNRCPFTGDNYRSLLIPVATTSSQLQFPSHYQRFAVSTFTFVDNTLSNIRGQIFFHCSTSVCVPSVGESCLPSCPSRRKRTVRSLATRNGAVVTAEGPVYFASQEEDGERTAGSRSSVVLLVPGWTVAVVLAVGFLMFLALAGPALAQFVGFWKNRNDRKHEKATVKA
ncbi:zona pellucida sperm-binding protein 4-like [Ambystoma mexicanum]|uniref:zona pellucida sperm-binding protein 4-like n=1 Tax=Ambystoma mexicanum TaxID=8296 RepID=UPI0037E8FB9A